MANKFDLADDFFAGLQHALIRSVPKEGFSWDTASELYMAGYQYGRKLKPQVITHLNEILEQHGVDTIGVVTVQN